MYTSMFACLCVRGLYAVTKEKVSGLYVCMKENSYWI